MLNKILIAIVMFSLGGFAVSGLQRKSEPISPESERAYQAREAIDYPFWRPWAIPIGEDFVKEQRHKNFFENSEKFPLLRDVVSVQVMPASDGGFTVSLIGVDGKQATLWVREGELPSRKEPIEGAHQGPSGETVFPVASITSY